MGPAAGAPEPHFAYDATKRVVDVALSLLLLVLCLPALAVACAIITVRTRQWPMMRQVRVGHLGREFDLFKLRTMRAHSPGAGATVADGGVLVAKTADDGRVFAVGRFLRRTSLDELPQLLNVLRGEMTLVGPRPGLPVEVARYPTSWRRRLAVKPGLSGLWQVSGRCEVEPRRRTAMDRYYIRRRSFGFDCAILLRTVGAVVSLRGAW